MINNMFKSMFNLVRSFFAPIKVSEATEKEIQSFIDSNDIMVFSKSYCPYCRSTKDLLSAKNKNFKVLELDQNEKGAEIQQGLYQLTGHWTVPNIFINQKHIGGNSDLQELSQSGKL